LGRRQSETIAGICWQRVRKKEVENAAIPEMGRIRICVVEGLEHGDVG
jgi:hypothetical protein